MAKKGKTKRVSYTLIPERSDTGKPMYELLDDILRSHHEALANQDVRIALAWQHTWKPDVDGRVTLGKCKKASDLDRELAPYDFVVILNKEFWVNPKVTADQRCALLDHELCHAAIAYDEHGEPKVDDRGRVIYRVRKHDIEEFRDIVARYGCYKYDLQQFAAALRRAQQLPLEDEKDALIVAAGRGVSADVEALGLVGRR